MLEIEQVQKGEPCRKCSSVCSHQPTWAESPQQHISMFDLFKVGLGPSSSHTVGTMAAANRFLEELKKDSLLQKTNAVRVDLYGSLALTGVGHATDKAILVGLSGEIPSSVDPDEAERIFKAVNSENLLCLGGAVKKIINFIPEKHMIFHFDEEMPQHPNGMKLTALSADGAEVYSNSYLSVGGGFVQTVAEFEGGHGTSSFSTRAGSEDSRCSTRRDSLTPSVELPVVPYPFSSASDLMRICRNNSMTIAEVMYKNELAISGLALEVVFSRIDNIWSVMHQCVNRGKKATGVMPVSGIRRQASTIYEQLKKSTDMQLVDHFAILDWVTLFARSVNEENACGGRIVTAPTNGAAGTIPAVLEYYSRFSRNSSPQGIRDFLATAGAFGILLKKNASISGAEAGCQAEVGSACAMAAAGLTAVNGGSIFQIENAAEIGLEHNLGMTCDPLMGLVQVPCIERNCVAAVKAITACRMALRGDGKHEVSFDSCVKTMYRTGLDMQAKYRETSLGGLAVHARKSSVTLLPHHSRNTLRRPSPT